MTTSAPLLWIERRDQVLWLTKNDPATSNGITLAMVYALHNALAEAANDPSVIAVVLDAEDGFHGGAALVREIRPEPRDLDADDAERIEEIGQGLGAAIAALDKPVIGIAKVGALGGGLELLCRCDFVFCTHAARFKLPEVTFGFVAAWGGTQWVGRLLPMRRPQELLLLGTTLDGAEAEACGLVTRALPDANAVDAEVARTIAQLRHCSPAAFREAKRSLRAAWEVGLGRGEALEREAQLAAMRSGDFRLGLEAAAQRARVDWPTGTIVARPHQAKKESLVEEIYR